MRTRMREPPMLIREIMRSVCPARAIPSTGTGTGAVVQVPTQ
jgi:hypothetical protein